jgi:hypothetical protein
MEFEAVSLGTRTGISQGLTWNWNFSAEGIHFQEPAMSAINQGIVLQIVQGSGAQF